MAGESGGESAGDVRDDQPDDVVDQDDDGTGDDQDDADGGQDDGGEYTPPTREEWEKVQRALARRRDERNKARTERDEARARLADRDKPKTDDATSKDGKAGDDGKDEPADRDQDSRWRLAAARSSAAVQLTAAGFSGTAKQAKRLTVLLDLADAEPDADGDFDFEEQIDELREEYPQLFRSQQQEEGAPRRVTRPTVADRGRRTERDATEDPSARTTAKLLRAAGMRPR